MNDDFVIILAADCGEEIEVYEPIYRITAYCDNCEKFHVYSAQE